MWCDSRDISQLPYQKHDGSHISFEITHNLTLKIFTYTIRAEHCCTELTRVFLSMLEMLSMDWHVARCRTNLSHCAGEPGDCNLRGLSPLCGIVFDVVSFVTSPVSLFTVFCHPPHRAGLSVKINNHKNNNVYDHIAVWLKKMNEHEKNLKKEQTKKKRGNARIENVNQKMPQNAHKKVKKLKSERWRFPKTWSKNIGIMKC